MSLPTFVIVDIKKQKQFGKWIKGGKQIAKVKEILTLDNYQITHENKARLGNVKARLDDLFSKKVMLQ